MKRKKHARYKFILEDESRLETVKSWTASRRGLILWAVAFVVVSMVLGALLVSFTPARGLLSGYVGESEKARTRLLMMRVDSLGSLAEAASAYCNNLENVLSGTKLPHSHTATEEQAGESPDSTALQWDGPLGADSILQASPEERRFLSMMAERERYNISVAAPIAGETMLFSPVNGESVFTTVSRTLPKGEIVMGKEAPVCAIADGTVIAVTQSLRDGGSTVIVQHSKGFVSRLSRLGTMLVEAGETVHSGQPIALANKGNARKAATVTVEMWFDGDVLIPYEYIGSARPAVPRFPVSLSTGSRRPGASP